jgi:cytidylate kinase
MIITIDGPAGGGKSTAARNLARTLGIAFLDTGAMYRALTLKGLTVGVNWDDPAAVRGLLDGTKIEVAGREGALRVLLDGADVADRIRTPEVTAGLAKMTHIPAVRAWMAAAQRAIGLRLGSVVTEGRDQGTVVFPDADVKFFLTADLAARAERRRRELADKGHDVDAAQLGRQLAERDRHDEQRAVAPLRRPTDAIDVNTTELSPEQTLAVLLDRIRVKTGGCPACSDAG